MARVCWVVMFRWAKFPDSRFGGWQEERGGESGTPAGIVSLVGENDVNTAWVKRSDSYWDQPCLKCAQWSYKELWMKLSAKWYINVTTEGRREL